MDTSNTPGPNLSIRRATADDAEALARLRWEFRAGIGEANEAEDAFVARCAAWMRERLNDATWRAWVVEADGGISGTAWLSLVEKMPNPVDEAEAYGYVTNVFLREHLRGRGAGARLMEAVVDECAVSGVEAVFLWPTDRSRSLYRRFGFEGDGPLMVRRWDAADEG
jgi:N-acetylglutamate synthase-like GNAT family acetyltransferase